MTLTVLFTLLSLGHPWPTQASSRSVQARVESPVGFQRLPIPPGGFAHWLRQFPVLTGHPQVRLHSGELKLNQSAQYLVLDIDVGRKNLQQCADATMRLRAEYLWSTKRGDDICFRFTSGDAARWREWKSGLRPKIKGNKVSWSRRAKPDARYVNFRRYLNTVFTYAGTYSLQRELEKPKRPRQVLPGDVFIAGGFPGHAVIVMDVAINARGQRKFLLAQS